MNILDALTGITPGTRVATLGVLGLIVVGVSTPYTEPNVYVQGPLIGVFASIFASGWYLIWYRGKMEGAERREKKRSSMPVSDLSQDLALTLTEPVSVEEAGKVPPLKTDKDKTKPKLLETVTRLRMREAASDGTIVYYDQGKYVPRKDITVLE